MNFRNSNWNLEEESNEKVNFPPLEVSEDSESFIPAQNQFEASAEASKNWNLDEMLFIQLKGDEGEEAIPTL